MSQYIVDFKDVVSQAEINQYLNGIGATIVKTFNAFKNAYVIEASSQPMPSDLIEHIINDEEQPIKLLGETIIIDNTVGLITESTLSKTILTSDSNQWWKLYSMSHANLDDTSITFPVKGAGATIYLVDSGIKKDHPDLVNADIVDLFSITSDFVDRKGHGTALASVMVGQTCGITNATVKNVKLFDTVVPTKQSDMLAAFDTIYNDFMTLTTNLGIINCSWVIARNSFIEAKMQMLIDAGIFIIASAGNNGTMIENVTPAAMEDVIVIGAYNSDFNPCDFSNYSGSEISVTGSTTNGGKLTGWAPGQDIWSATLNDGFGNSSGTSIAAAIHSAIMAYHLSGSLIDSGRLPSFYIKDINKKNYFFGRNGILDLSDEKYSNSPNIVSVIFNDISPLLDSIPEKQNYVFIVYLNKPFKKFIVNPKKTRSIEIIQQLPANISINNEGMLCSNIKSLDTNYIIQDSKIKVNDLDGRSFEMNLKFIIKATEIIDPSNINETDPTINYLLQDLYYCSSAGFVKVGITCYDDCFNLCPGEFYGACVQTSWDKATDLCQCTCYRI